MKRLFKSSAYFATVSYSNGAVDNFQLSLGDGFWGITGDQVVKNSLVLLNGQPTTSGYLEIDTTSPSARVAAKGCQSRQPCAPGY